MEIFKINESFTNIPKLKEPISLCVGYFDGVHIAHQRLIIEAKIKGDAPVGVITFSYNIKRDKNLTSLDARINLFKILGVDYVFILPFTEEIKNMSHDVFKETFFDKVNISSLFMGADYTFGKGKLGNSEYLSKYYRVHVVPFYMDNDRKISSVDIVSLVKEGNIKKANFLLGRAYQIKGKVVRGFQTGRTLNFPTANIEIIEDYVVPKYGVYKVIVYILGIPYLGIANVGVHPTINKLSTPLIETHILNYSGDLYGKEIYIEFIDFIREEKKFASIEELRKQINKDIEFAKSSS